MRKMMSIVLAAALTAGVLSGCGAAEGPGDNKDSGSGMGRYVEEDMELPLAGGEAVVNLTRSGEGNPLLFAMDLEMLIRYEYKDGKWERTPLEWTKGLRSSDMITFDDVEETADGTQYVMTADNETMQRTVTRRAAGAEDGVPGERLNIPYLSQETDYGYPLVYDLLVDDAGHYWLMDAMGAAAVAVDAQSGEKVLEIPVSQNFSTTQKTLFLAGEEVAVGTGAGEYTIYNTGTLEELGKLKSQCRTDEGYTLCRSGDDWYQISTDGISRMNAGNEIEEIIMDGSSGAMGSPLNMISGMISGGEGEFYALYSRNDTGDSILEHYFYDKNLSSVPENTLTVFGLTQSDTVQQAVTQFQKAHSDVKVEFHTLGKSPSEVTSDDIRTLNTELLSGNGADVLLLDGLPTQSYIDKGILEDLTDLSEELMSSGEYLESMMKNTVQDGGKIYGLPVKFSVPLMYGNEDSMNALESIDSLRVYLEEHPGLDLFGPVSEQYIRDVLFMLYQDEIIAEDGKVNREMLKELLSLESDVIKNSEGSGEDGMFFTGDDDIIISSPFDSGSGIVEPAQNSQAAATVDVGSLGSMMIPYAVMRQMELSPRPIGDMYHPQGIAGINSSSAQKELAAEFVKYLFSDEVQSALLSDGFPVLKTALEAKADEAEASADHFSAAVMVTGEDGTESELMAAYPLREEVEALTEMSGTLNRPMVQNRVVWNIYQEEADKYLEGSADAEEAAENIAQKVDTYLAE